LDSIQVDFLIRATQAHQRSMSLAAPHVTVLNTQTASVMFNVSQPYVADLEAEAGNRVGMYDPEIRDASTGVQLYVTPRISHDKRYVEMEVEAFQTQLLRIETFTFNIAGEATADTTEEGGLTGLAGSTASTGRIQQPVMQINRVLTQVRVPDGGTLLLGGQKLAGEVEKEMGVPALSNIPILNRFFSNRGVTKDESVLLILIKPKIILPDEAEERRFGGFEMSESQ
jgi:type II secretory pathway component GspD/PulD (secretin)